MYPDMLSVLAVHDTSNTTNSGWNDNNATLLLLLVQQMMEWQWHQLDHMQIICTLLQTDNHNSTSPLRFLQAGCPSCRPPNSVKAPKAFKALLHIYTAQNGVGWITKGWGQCVLSGLNQCIEFSSVLWLQLSRKVLSSGTRPITPGRKASRNKRLLCFDSCTYLAFYFYCCCYQSCATFFVCKNITVFTAREGICRKNIAACPFAGFVCTCCWLAIMLCWFECGLAEVCTPWVLSSYLYDCHLITIET